MSARDYTQIPPRSTGDRVQMAFTVEFGYSNQTGPDAAVGEEIHLLTSGFGGTIARVLPDNASSGKILIAPNAATKSDLSIKPISGEQIQIDGVDFALATAFYEEVFTNTYQLVSSLNPTYGQIVDQNGSAQTTFKEGSPTLDSFGRLRVGESNVVGDYVFTRSILPQHFTSTETDGGTVTHEFNTQALLLSTSSSTSSVATHTTNSYFHYIPTIGMGTTMTVACGDNGKANLVREWGYYDDENGLFFRQDENGFNVVVRTDTSGVVTETVVNQNDFNVDKVDGTASAENLSFMNLDVTKNNIYWIDFQWLGAGIVRFGVYNEHGNRITVHEVRNSNRNPVAYMRTANLPLTINQYNTAATGSSSEMRVWCAAVYYESSVGLNNLGEPLGFSVRNVIDSAGSPQDTDFHITTVQAQLTFGGRINRSVGLLSSFEASIYDVVTKNKVPGKLKIYQSGTVTSQQSPAWVSDSPITTLEHAEKVTVVFKGFQAAATPTDGYLQVDDLSHLVTYTTGSIKLNADGTQPQFSFWFEPLFPLDNDIIVDIGMVFKEYIN